MRSYPEKANGKNYERMFSGDETICVPRLTQTPARPRHYEKETLETNDLILF